MNGDESSFIRDLLRGGLPAVLDFPAGQPASSGSTVFPEENPPQDNQTRENANPAFAGINSNMLITGAIIVVAGAVAFAIVRSI